jgi:hypothetical protein
MSSATFAGQIGNPECVAMSFLNALTPKRTVIMTRKKNKSLTRKKTN